jgi:hypothetical protein
MQLQQQLAMLPLNPKPGQGTSAVFEQPAAIKLSSEDIAALKTHIQRCWASPPGINNAASLKIVLRVSFQPNGRLAAEPALVAASASPFGPALVENAKKAIQECQPFSVLPPSKYKEWKNLDLGFSPKGII